MFRASDAPLKKDKNGPCVIAACIANLVLQHPVTCFPASLSPYLAPMTRKELNSAKLELGRDDLGLNQVKKNPSLNQNDSQCCFDRGLIFDTYYPSIKTTLRIVLIHTVD